MHGADRRWWWWISAITALGLALRIAGAQGALWLDEAWSAVLAHDAGTPIAIFLNINHDNNHHLNSLWLQTIGLDAHPLVARALSIVTGTTAIPIAGLIGARQAPAAGLMAAAFFAVSPMLVTLGSEARGYAPMVLAFLTAILLVDRWLAGEADKSPRTALALCFLLGALSQLTMLFAFCAIAGWVALTLWRRSGALAAAKDTASLLLPSFIVLLAVAALVFAAAASSTGFQFGRYEPFDLGRYAGAIADAAGFTTGLPIWTVVLVPVLVALARRRLWLHALATVALPLTLAVLQVGNTGYPRYYLVAAAALLVLLGDLAWAGLRAGGWRRVAAAFALGAAALGCSIQDADLVRNRRGDVGTAIRAMIARAPTGAEVILDRSTGLALLRVTAAEARYPLRILEDQPCGPARFLFLDRFRGEPMPPASIRCGRRYAPIASARARGLSGTDWTLYEAQP